MKKSEVPQDKSSLNDKNVKELYYAVDEDGKYTTELSSGWEPKTIVQEKTFELINERIEEARQNVKKGICSPVVYFMEVNKMDWAILSDYMEMWKWRIKRHAQPKVFKKLSDKTIQKYADTFGITATELKAFKGE